MTQNQSGKQLFEWIETDPQHTGVYLCRIENNEGEHDERRVGYMGRWILNEGDKVIGWLSPAQPSTGNEEHLQQQLDHTIETLRQWVSKHAQLEAAFELLKKTSTGNQLPTDEEIEEMKADAEELSQAWLHYFDDDLEKNFEEGKPGLMWGNICSIQHKLIQWNQRLRAQGYSDKWIRVEDGLPGDIRTRLESIYDRRLSRNETIDLLVKLWEESK